jgi:ribonuclease G
VSRTLLLSVSPGEIWAALEDEGELEALRVVRTGNPSLVGAVILGRVVALRPELPAALVDVGSDRPGFLDAKDIDPRRGIAGLTEGQALIVEVMKEARADKAAGLRLFRDKSARGARIEAAARDAQPPKRLDPATPLLATLLAEFSKPPPDRIVIDDRGALAEARGFLARQGSRLIDRLEFYGDATPLFDHAGVAGAIDSALARRVELPGGGALIIDIAQAAIVIDVDGGKSAALVANLEAARAVARQIRWRNLAGPIVIDFIGMKKRPDRDNVLAALEAAFAADSEKPELLGWTRLGHVELVRRRRHPSLAEILGERSESGGWRKTALTIALAALRSAAREANAQPGRPLTLSAHPEILSALGEGEGLAARRGLEARLGRGLGLAPHAMGMREVFDIRAGSTI